MPQVMLTPHMVSATEEAVRHVREKVCRTTIDWARTGWAPAIANSEVRGRMRAGWPPLADLGH